MLLVCNNFSSSDFSKLVPQDVIGNCRIAFDITEKLGLPRVIEPQDMNLLAVPDKLAVITYLHQMRAHFTGNQLEIHRIGDTTDDSSYVIGNYKSDNFNDTKLLDINEMKMHFQPQNLYDDEYSDKFSNFEDTTTVSILKNVSGKHLLQNKEQCIPEKEHSASQVNGKVNDEGSKEKQLLMSRRELMDPFASDEEDEKTNMNDNKPNEKSLDASGGPTITIDAETANVCVIFSKDNLNEKFIYTQFII
jgi:hypothetical protein